MLASAPEKTTFNLTFKNVGKTPTTGLYIKAQIASELDGLPLADRFCADGIGIATSKQDLGFHNTSIVPQDVYSSAKISGQEDFSDISIDDIIKYKRPAIIGCVTYTIRFGDDLHKTELIAPIDVGRDHVCIGNVFTFKPT